MEEKCFYCNRPATHNDLVEVGDTYKIANVCFKHISFSLSS